MISLRSAFLVAVCFLVMFWTKPSEAASTLPFVDHLSYATGNLGAVGGAGNWNGSSSAITVVTNNLDGTGLGVPASSGSMAAMTAATGATYNQFASASGDIVSGKVYCSFLLRVTDASTVSTTGEQVISLNIQNGSSTRYASLYFRSVSGVVSLGVAKNAGNPAYIASGPGSNLGDGNVYFVVFSQEFVTNGTSDDVVKLWVNPASLGGAEDVNPAATAPGAPDITSATGMGRLYFNGGVGCNVDEIRIGTNWASVAPGNGSSPVTNNAPVITQAILLPQAMVLRGTNGSPAGGYQVIASTDLRVAASNWPAVGNYAFDSSGNFDSTNPILPGTGSQFFRLLVGATNPPAATAPVLTSQPQSLVVVTGASTNFSVSVTGTSPLNYFWSLNTNTPVGGNSSVLLLSGITTNDAGSYRVIVTNNFGSATSAVATLTVLVPPVILAGPTNLAAVSGGSANFGVTASGSAPLRYQWYFNTNTLVANATNALLTLASVSATNAGNYSVVVTNVAGSVTSAVATLTISGPPVITLQPQSVNVALSNDATFTVAATGTASLAYRWFFNTNTLIGGNSNSFTRLSVQAGDAGTYSVIITNSFGAVTSSFATLSVNTSAVNLALFNLVGFGGTTTGGGLIAETSSLYAKVTNALDLANAIDSATIKVIEITTNLDLGWLEIGAAAQAVGPFRIHATPSLHPRLLQTGVSLLDIQSKNGLTIFSANGATIRHCTFNIKNARNVIVRNLKFDELWEWDEGTKGNYDSKDWDFIDLGNGGGTGTTTNIWIDHCTFTKTYDGICDIKGGANHITLSWNRYVGDDGATNPNSFVWQQINMLESNKAAYAMYNSLRTASGFTPAEIVTISQGQDKTHLAGANSGVGADNEADAAENALISITFHHQWFQNCWDRCVPRLRGGNVHNFNIYADDSLAFDAKALRDARGVSSSYNFNPPLNGSIATENGAILVENSIYQDCLTPLRNNQTDPNNAAYTGKIMALNSIYSLRQPGGGTNVYQGSSTNAPGNTYFGPVQAAVIPFSWNLPSGVLPYTYTNVLTPPTQLKAVLTNSAYGCGAGVLTWAKTNWLKTSY